MTDVLTILTNRFPKTDERIEGQLVFLEQYGFDRIDKPALERVTGLAFYKAKFFTGYTKFTIIDTIIGLSAYKVVFLLTNPLFSDKYSDILEQFEKINSAHLGENIISEIIDLYKQTGAIITEAGINKYQIWFGDDKWRLMEFETKGTLKIKTTPNSGLALWRLNE